MMKRRTFLQFFSLPALAFVRPRATVAPALRAGLVYSDSVGTPDLAVLQDDDPGSGIEYQP